MVKSPEQPWVVSSVGAHLLAWARRDGIDVDAVLENIAFEPELFTASAGRIPVRAMQALWASLASVSTDPAFALRSGAAAAAAIIPVLGPAMVASPSIYSAMGMFAKHHELVSNSVDVLLERVGDEVRLRCRWIEEIGRTTPQIVESAASHWVVFQEELTGAVVDPKRIVFPFERPLHADRHAEFYGCDIRYGGDSLRVVWAGTDADRPFLTHDPMVLSRLEGTLAGLQGDNASLSARVFSLLMRLDRPASISAANIAERLAVSTRTLQRKLAEEGLSYRGIAGRVLQKRAEEWLAEKQLSIDEVVWRLGYAKRSSFHRAFVRWSGATPAVWREKK